MKECLIEGCPFEARPVIKSAGKVYYACKKHEAEVEHIAQAEKHVLSEMERMKKQRELLSKQDDDQPFWIKF